MSWLERSAEAFPAGIDKVVEYLPDIDMSKCTLDVDDVIWATTGGKRAEEGGQLLDPLDDHDITVGKLYDFASKKAYDHVLQTNGDHALRFEVGHKPSSESLWASKLPCLDGVGGWQCMFGEYDANVGREARHDLKKRADTAEAEKAIAQKFWRETLDSLRALNGGKESDPKKQFNNIVSLGWIVRRMVPFTACHGGPRQYRTCQPYTLNNPDVSPMVRGERKKNQHQQRIFASVHMRMGDACDKRLEKPRPYVGTIWGTLGGGG